MKLRNQQVLAMLLAGAMSISSVMTGVTAFAEEAEQEAAETIEDVAEIDIPEWEDEPAEGEEAFSEEEIGYDDPAAEVPADDLQGDKDDSFLIEDIFEEAGTADEEILFDQISHMDAESFDYDGDALTFIKADSSAFGMFTAMEGTTISLDNGKAVIHYVPKNTTTYEGFYLGCSIEEISNEDSTAVANRDSLDASYTFYTLDEGAYELKLDLSYCGKAWPIAVIKNKFNKESWTSAEQYYLAIPSLEQLTKDLVFEYDADVSFIKENGDVFGMFRPQDGTKVTLSGDRINIVYYPRNTTTYAGFYFNCSTGEISNEDSTAVANTDSLDALHTFYTMHEGAFEIELDTDYCGKAWPIAVVKNRYSNESWTSAEQYYLGIPTLKSLEDQAAADAVSSQLAALNKDAPLTDKAAVEAARKAYENLTKDQKELVDPKALSNLQAAEQSVKKAEEANKAPAVGTKLTIGDASYTVTAGQTVTYNGPAKKTLKTASVPDTVTIKGKSYKVTAIAANAFKNNKKLKKLTVGVNVQNIGAGAFSGCKAMKNMGVKTGVLSKVGKKAFYKTGSKNYSSLKIKVPKKMLKKYRKWFRSAKLSKKAKVKK